MRFPCSLLLQVFLLGVFLLSSLASAQDRVETFENGENPDEWEVVIGAFVDPTGGHPGGALVVEDLAATTLICDELVAQPFASFSGSYSQGGDWIAAGIDEISVDVRVDVGPVLATSRVRFVVRSSACSFEYVVPGSGPATGGGWRHFSAPLDAASTTVPPGWAWTSFSNCGNNTANTAWGNVMGNVEEMLIFIDGDISQSCAITAWRARFDNIAVRSISSLMASSVCAPLPNSTGRTGSLQVNGDSRALQNDVTLEAVDLPSGFVGFFVVSDSVTAPQQPFGSNGTLCLGGAIGRVLSSLQNTGTFGYAEYSPDLTAVTTAAGAVAVQPGETWTFQFWHRDLPSGGGSSNLTDALSLTFQ